MRFGNAKRRGVVTKVDVAPPKGIETSQIERVVEELPKPLVELALWIAEYYGSTPGRAFALVAPVQRKARGERPQPAARDGLQGEAEPAHGLGERRKIIVTARIEERVLRSSRRFGAWRRRWRRRSSRWKARR